MKEKIEKKNWKKKIITDLENKNWILTFVEKETFIFKNKIEITNKNIFLKKKLKKKYLILFKILTKLEKKAYVYVLNENKYINIEEIKQEFKNIFFIIKIKNHLYENKFIENIKENFITNFLISIIKFCKIHIFNKLNYIYIILAILILFFINKSTRKGQKTLCNFKSF